MNDYVTLAVIYLNSIPPELVSFLVLITCYVAIFILAKLWKEIGLISYVIIAVIACNIQVLQVTNYLHFMHPIALGTVVYASIFMVSDLLTELYGKAISKKSVQLGFVGSIVFTSMMFLTIGHRKIDPTIASDYSYNNQIYEALKLIFTPNIGIVCASLSAYFISQYLEIYLFSYLKKITHSYHLWLRVTVSILFAAWVDSAIFGILAWKIFVPLNISWQNLFYTYIVGGFVIQIAVAIFNIPIFYFMIKFLRK